jgi:hypothetical protein
MTGRHHQNRRGGGVSRLAGWRLLLSVGAAGILATTMLVWVAVWGQAQVAPEIELSNSCAAFTIPATTTQLTIWGSHISGSGPFVLIDRDGFLAKRRSIPTAKETSLSRQLSGRPTPRSTPWFLSTVIRTGPS